jgi:transcriptional regulator with XRE-family HTH domain
MTGRTKTQRERDNRRISQLYLQGEMQADIADALGLSQATVSRALKALQSDWRQSALIDINEAKARELAKIDTLELEYWTAWKRSQEDAESEITKMQGNPPKPNEANPLPAKMETQKKREGQSGNPAFLRGIEWCINKRCEILGVDAPVKQQLTGANGEPLIPPPSVMSDEERITRMKELAVLIADEVKKLNA